MKTELSFPELLQAFFTDRLMDQCNASPHTIASYRDTFRLLLAFAQRSLHKSPVTLRLRDWDAPFICRFLTHLEKDRGNSPRSRNARLAAIHSFFTFVALQEPGLAAVAQRVLAIRGKRYAKRPIDFLSRPEAEALLATPDQKTWSGRRDRTLLLLGLQTGLRVSEMIGLHCQDIVMGTGAHVRCTGKGRKTRCVPLRKETVAALRGWLSERNAQPADILFPSARGVPLSPDGVQYLLAKYLAVALIQCPSLKNKTVSPHVLRHTCAMDLLQHGVDRSVIALWLGHESMDSTQAYLHANLQLSEEALALTEPFYGQSRRYRPPDHLMAFLSGL